MARQEQTAVRNLREIQDLVILTRECHCSNGPGRLQEENEETAWGPCVPEDLEASNQCNREENNQRNEGSATEEAHFKGPDEQTQSYSKQTPYVCTKDPQA